MTMVADEQLGTHWRCRNYRSPRPRSLWSLLTVELGWSERNALAGALGISREDLRERALRLAPWTTEEWILLAEALGFPSPFALLVEVADAEEKAQAAADAIQRDPEFKKAVAASALSPEKPGPVAALPFTPRVFRGGAPGLRQQHR